MGQPQLEKIYKKSKTGKRYPDLLIEVHLKNGNTEIIIIHIEIQTYLKKDFPERVYTYNYRARDIFHKDVVSLIVLIDQDPKYRIDSYKKKYWGFELIFKYPIVKILDYKGKELELKKDKNPFSEVVIVQLQAMEISSKTDTEKKELKSKLIMGS